MVVQGSRNARSSLGHCRILHQLAEQSLVQQALLKGGVVHVYLCLYACVYIHVYIYKNIFFSVHFSPVSVPK